MKRTPLSILAIGAMALSVFGCAQEGDGTSVLIGGPGDGPSAPVSSDDPAAVAERAVGEVTSYWEATYPEVYGDEFVPLAGFHPYGPDTEAPPCGSPPPRYEEIADNAFYCPSDDIIAWDEYSLMPALNREFGSFTVAIVIAHEFGHAVQGRFVTSDRTVDLELQADCFAGAWTGHVADGNAQGFGPGDIDLDKTVAGMLAIRDVPGTSADDPYAHGSGFDRVSAFQDGYENGAAKCEEYADETSDRTTVEIPFDPDEFDTEGNFPLEDDPDLPDGEGLLTKLERDLNDFYTRVFDEIGTTFEPVNDLVLVDPDVDSVECGGETAGGRDLEYAAVYCEDENIVVLDGAGLVTSLNEDIGDFAVASEVARLWAVAAQSQIGDPEGGEADLQADCLTGAWAAWTFPSGPEGDAPSEELRMSAGDLDEGITGFLAYGTTVGDGSRTVFERTSALRTGFFESYDACEEYGPFG